MKLQTDPELTLEKATALVRARVSGKTARNSKRRTTKATKHRCHGIEKIWRAKAQATL